MDDTTLTITVFVTAVTAIATAVIAIYAWQTHKLTKEMQKRDEEHKQKTQDLYQAIVVATILSVDRAEGSTEKIINKFNEFYSGEAQIFRK